MLSSNITDTVFSCGSGKRSNSIIHVLLYRSFLYHHCDLEFFKTSSKNVMLPRHSSLHRVQGVLFMRCAFPTFHADPKYHNTSMPPAMSDRCALEAYKCPVFASFLPYLFIRTWFLFFKIRFAGVHARRGVALFLKRVRRSSMRIFCLTRLCEDIKCSKSLHHGDTRVSSTLSKQYRTPSSPVPLCLSIIPTPVFCPPKKKQWST
jgi:hypothetical protein